MGVKNALEARILKIFVPWEPNENGLAQRRCSLCKGGKGTGAIQLDTAKSKMHGHLALQCEYLLSSKDPKDQEFLAELRKHCPRSVATSKRSREILREAQGDQDDDLHGATQPKKPRGKKAKEALLQQQQQAAQAEVMAQAMQAQALQQAQAAQIQVQAQLNQLTAQQNMQQALNQANQVAQVNQQLPVQLPAAAQMQQQAQLGMAPQNFNPAPAQVSANTWAAWQRSAAAGLQAGLYNDNRAWWGMDGLGAAAHSAAALHGALQQQQHLQQFQPSFAPEPIDDSQKRAKAGRGRGRRR